MTAGRPPTPTATKKVRGNPGKRRLNNDPAPPPAPAGGVAPPLPAAEHWPEGGHAARMWAHMAGIVAPMGLLTTADADSLAIYCDAYAEYAAAGEVVAGAAASAALAGMDDVSGMTYERVTERGGTSIQPHPAVAIRTDAWRRMEKMLSNFGMNPVARSRVAAPDAGDVDEFAAFDGPQIAGGKRAQ